MVTTMVIIVILMASLFIPFATSSATLLYIFTALWGYFSGSFYVLSPGMFVSYLQCLVLGLTCCSMYWKDMRAQGLRTILWYVLSTYSPWTSLTIPQALLICASLLPCFSPFP
jgi:hypothetical protein